MLQRKSLIYKVQFNQLPIGMKIIEMELNRRNGLRSCDKNEEGNEKKHKRQDS